MRMQEFSFFLDVVAAVNVWFLVCLCAFLHERRRILNKNFLVEKKKKVTKGANHELTSARSRHPAVNWSQKYLQHLIISGSFTPTLFLATWSSFVCTYAATHEKRLNSSWQQKAETSRGEFSILPPILTHVSGPFVRRY